MQIPHPSRLISMSVGVALVIGAHASAQGVVMQRNISLAMAKTMAEATLAACKSKGFNTAAAVVDRSGQIIVMLRDEQASAQTTEMARRKAYTARMFRMSTAEFAKRTQDPLRRADGTRRLAVDPFAATQVTISFENSVIDELTAGPLVSNWVIDFDPDSESVHTWDDILRVRERWKANFLDEKTVKKWLGDFSSYCKRAKVQIAADADVIDAVKGYQEHLSDCGFEGHAFLKTAAFKLLYRKCEAGSPRLLPVFRDLAGLPQT